MKRLILAPLLGTLMIAGCSSSKSTAPTASAPLVPAAGPNARAVAPSAPVQTPPPATGASTDAANANAANSTPIPSFALPVPEAAATACEQFQAEQSRIWTREQAQERPQLQARIGRYQGVLRSAYGLLSQSQKDDLKADIAELRLLGSRAQNPRLPEPHDLAGDISGLGRGAYPHQSTGATNPAIALRRSVFDHALGLMEPMRPRMDHRLQCFTRHASGWTSVYSVTPASHLENTLSTLRVEIDREDANFPIVGPEFFDHMMSLGDGTCTENAGMRGLLPTVEGEVSGLLRTEYSRMRPLNRYELDIGQCPQGSRRCLRIETPNDTGVIDRSGLFITWSDARHSKLLLLACDLNAQSRTLAPHVEVNSASFCARLDLETGSIVSGDLDSHIVSSPNYLDRAPDRNFADFYASNVRDAQQAYARGDSEWLAQSRYAPFASCLAPATPAPTSGPMSVQ